MDTKEIIKKVRKVEIKTKKLTNNVFGGEYQSTFKGRGMTFSEVRSYEFGDDVRTIDWNVTARYNEPFVKVFEEERELTLMLMVDISGSKLFGSEDQIKKNIVTEISATLAFSAIQNNDKVGLILFTDQFTNIIKDSFERLRPCRVDELQQYLRNIEVRCGKYGFFSAHAANSMAVTTLLISSFKFCYKKWISLLLIFWVVFFSYSRIYLGVHYPLDTFFGLFFGLLFGRTVHYIINYINFIEKIKETE